MKQILSILVLMFTSGIMLGQYIEKENINVKSSKDEILKADYDYEKFKKTYEEEMAKMEKDTVPDKLVKPQAEDTYYSINKDFFQINNLKTSPGDFTLITIGSTKCELLVNSFLSMFRLEATSEVSANYESLSRGVNKINIGEKFFIESVSDIYSGHNFKNCSDELVNIYFLCDTKSYYITNHIKGLTTDSTSTRENSFSIFEFSETDTSLIADFHSGQDLCSLRYTDSLFIFNSVFEKNLQDFGFNLDMKPEYGYGLLSISKKRIKELKKTKNTNLQVVFPEIKNVGKIREEFEIRLKEQEKLRNESQEQLLKSNTLKINYDYEKFKKAFEEEMKKN